MENSLTKALADETMKGRGYISVASSNQGNKQYYSRSTEFGPLHCEVNLEKQTILIDCLELKLMCQLRTTEFNFFHNDFDRFENVIYLYAQKCLDLDVFKLLNELQKPTPPPKEKKQKKGLEERKKEFWDKIRGVAKEKYSKEMALEFYRYWTEHNENGKLMRFEKEDTFNLASRLSTWARNQEKFDKSRKNFVEKKIEQQNETVKIDNSKQLNFKELF